jgi:hypothetical protein
MGNLEPWGRPHELGPYNGGSNDGPTDDSANAAPNAAPNDSANAAPNAYGEVLQKLVRDAQKGRRAHLVGPALLLGLPEMLGLP